MMMKRLLRILVVLVSALFVSTVSQSQSGGMSGNEAAKNRIAITVSVKQTTFKIGDPILLDILVKNISEYKYCEKSIVETNHAEWNDYNVEVKDAGGTMISRVSRPLLPLRQRPELSGSRGLLCIAPGELIKERIIVDQIVNMSGAGTYYVQVIHRDRGTDTDVVSNSIQINITQ